MNALWHILSFVDGLGQYHFLKRAICEHVNDAI